MQKEGKRKILRKWLVHDLQKNWPKKTWFAKGADFAGEFKTFCKAEGVQIYSTMWD